MTILTAELIGYTQPSEAFKKRVNAEVPEDILGYCARISNPSNRNNFETQAGLFNYCMRNKHWSIFEMVSATVEVEAPRDITRQLLRHRSFSFQEFSQRYSDQIETTERWFRRQDKKNRQNSIDDLDESLQEEYEFWVESYLSSCMATYKKLLSEGVAKECARVVLPEGLTMSRVCMNGTLRSYLHYLDVRDDEGVTQHEHVLLAREIRKAIQPIFPNIFTT